MVSETEPVDWNTPTTVTGDWVTAERTVERTNDDVIVTLEITATDDMPVSVEMADEFPEEWSVQEVGVHPDFEPSEVVARSNRFEFSDIVDPDAPLEVVYGAKIGAPESTVLPNPLVIQSERRLESLQRSTDDLVAGDDGGAASASNDDHDPETDDRDDPFAYAGQSGGDLGAIGGPDDQPVPFTRSPSAADTDPLPSSDGSATVTFETDRPEGTPDDGSVVEAFAEELGSDAVSDDAVATIREALRPAESRREAVRVDHLQSRVEEFAAYADALGSFLDEHGSLDGILDDQEARLDDLRAELDGLRTELDAAADERASVDERVETTVDRIESVEGSVDDLQTVRDDVDRLQRDHEEAIDELDGALEAHEASVSAVVERVEADVAALGDRVEKWDATRRRLADLLTGEFGPAETSSGEDAGDEAGSSEPGA